MSSTRLFGTPRPSHEGISPTRLAQPRGNQEFHTLPTPTGAAPYHIGLDTILPAADINSIKAAGKLVFHLAGDTGGIKDPIPQSIVIRKMEEQLAAPHADRPAFFYIPGDVVYFNGQSSEYYSQFYQAYENYHVPIIAIPGNHDGDPGPSSVPSLDAFIRNFCNAVPVLTPEAQDVSRHAMTQPNCFFTLNAPFLTIVGLYSNVPEGGQIEQDQIDWFVNELKTAPTDKALMVAVHHPAYSFDDHHSGSTHIRDVLDQSFQKAGRTADLVVTGHVHNYQRFTRTQNGRQVPILVAGAGGFHNLHHMIKAVDGGNLQVPMHVPSENLMLEDYVDDRHGFLRFTVDAHHVVGEYFTVPRSHESWSQPARKYDSFILDWKHGKLLPHTP